MPFYGFWIFTIPSCNFKKPPKALKQFFGSWFSYIILTEINDSFCNVLEIIPNPKPLVTISILPWNYFTNLNVPKPFPILPKLKLISSHYPSHSFSIPDFTQPNPPYHKSAASHHLIFRDLRKAHPAKNRKNERSSRRRLRPKNTVTKPNRWTRRRPSYGS